jgi:hypothetical protein
MLHQEKNVIAGLRAVARDWLGAHGGYDGVRFKERYSFIEDSP